MLFIAEQDKKGYNNEGLIEEKGRNKRLHLRRRPTKETRFEKEKELVGRGT